MIRLPRGPLQNSVWSGLVAVVVVVGGLWTLGHRGVGDVLFGVAFGVVVAAAAYARGRRAVTARR